MIQYTVLGVLEDDKEDPSLTCNVLERLTFYNLWRLLLNTEVGKSRFTVPL